MVNDSQKSGRHTFLFPLHPFRRRIRVALFVVWGRVGSKRTLVEANVGNYWSIISLKVSIKSMAFKWTMASNGWLWVAVNTETVELCSLRLSCVGEKVK